MDNLKRRKLHPPCPASEAGPRAGTGCIRAISMSLLNPILCKAADLNRLPVLERASAQTPIKQHSHQMVMSKNRDNFNLDSTRQAGQVTSRKERNTGEHREIQADSGQQGLETPPHKPGPPNGLREGLARAATGSGRAKCRPRGQRPAERVGRAVEAPPRRTPPSGRGA